MTAVARCMFDVVYFFILAGSIPSAKSKERVWEPCVIHYGLQLFGFVFLTKHRFMLCLYVVLCPRAFGFELFDRFLSKHQCISTPSTYLPGNTCIGEINRHLFRESSACCVL